tara:strand:- start:939 stop:1310 length:372 start_codon:yes stop_codon:yes gene_type:complete
VAIANQQSGPNPAKEWEMLCRVSELKNGEATRIEIGDLKLSASKINESIYVVSDMCTHANYSLSDGPLHAGNLTIECWKHGAQFCLSTGAALTLPATKPLDTFPTKVYGENVYINLPRKGNNE